MGEMIFNRLPAIETCFLGFPNSINELVVLRVAKDLARSLADQYSVLSSLTLRICSNGEVCGISFIMKLLLF